MFELADRLIGIYKTENCTKSVTIDPKAIAEKAQAAAAPAVVKTAAAAGKAAHGLSAL